MALQYFSVPMSGDGGFEFRVAYDAFPQGAGNLVAATIQWRRVGSYGYASHNSAASYSLSINGTGGSTQSSTVNFSAPSGGAIGWQWIASHQAVITGTTASISASFATGTQGAGSGSFSTLTVPIATASRASFTTVGGPAITAFDAGQQITIHTNRQSTAYTHNLIVSFGGTYQTIATGVGASFNWTPPLSLLTQIPSSLSGNGYIRTETYSGSTYLGRLDTVFTLRAGVGVIPVVSSVVATEQNSSVASIVGRPVQSLSSLALNVNAAGVQGSTVIAREATFRGATVPTGTIVNASQAGTLPITGRATDSRGRQSASWSGSLTVLPYSLPAATSFQARRANVSNVVDENGTYLRVDLSAAVQSLINSTERNSLTVRVFTRPHSGGVWTARNVIVHGSLTYNGSLQVTGGAIFSGMSSWDVQVRVEDKFAVYTADVVVSSTRVPIDVNETSVGIGKMHEQGTLDVGGPIYSDSNLVLTRGNLSLGLWGNAGSGNTQTAPGNDFNNAIDTGFYYGSGTTANMPESGLWWNLTVENAGSRSTQYARRLDAQGPVYKRWRNTPATPVTWSPWVQAGFDRVANQSEVNAGATWSVAVTPATLRNRDHAPWAMAAGRATSSASGAVTVTFPAGRFSQPPRVSVTPGNHANVLVPRIAANPTATSFQVQMFTMPGAGLATAAFDWIAVQMAAGNGSG